MKAVILPITIWDVRRAGRTDAGYEIAAILPCRQSRGKHLSLPRSGGSGLVFRFMRR